MGDCSQFYYFLKKVKQKLFITPRRKARPKQKNVDTFSCFAEQNYCETLKVNRLSRHNRFAFIPCSIDF